MLLHTLNESLYPRLNVPLHPFYLPLSFDTNLLISACVCTSPWGGLQRILCSVLSVTSAYLVFKLHEGRSPLRVSFWRLLLMQTITGNAGRVSRPSSPR